MTPVVTVFYPFGDPTFRATAQHVLEQRDWDLESDEGIALLQAVLQTSYPMAAVVADRSSESGWDARTFLDFYRDGASSVTTATLAWLSAVYDIAAPAAYHVALRLLQETARAQAVVERAFADLRTEPRIDIEAAAATVYASAIRRARAELRADYGLPPS